MSGQEVCEPRRWIKSCRRRGKKRGVPGRWHGGREGRPERGRGEGVKKDGRNVALHTVPYGGVLGPRNRVRGIPVRGSLSLSSLHLALHTPPPIHGLVSPPTSLPRPAPARVRRRSSSSSSWFLCQDVSRPALETGDSHCLVGDVRRGRRQSPMPANGGTAIRNSAADIGSATRDCQRPPIDGRGKGSERAGGIRHARLVTRITVSRSIHRYRDAREARSSQVPCV